VLRRLLGLAGALVLVAGAVLIALFVLALLGGEVSAGGLLGAVAGAALVAGALRLVPGDALLGGYSALVYVLLFAPILIVIVYAFNAGRQVQVWEGLSAKWFGEALADEEIRSAIGRSLQIAVASALVSTALGTATALALLRARWRTRVSFDIVLFLALVVPELVLAIAALIFFVNAGFELGELTMFLGHTIFNTALVTLVVRARAVSMGEGHEEASADLGAGPLATFRQVTLPRLFPAVLAGFLLAFTFSFDDVIISSFTSGAGNQTWPLRVLSALRFGLSPEINATATMMLGVTLLGLGLGALVLRISARRQGAQGVLGLSRGDVRPAAPVAAGG
jgi:spermidine/putrescine transport system permease protein/putrescine transport system permease protein